MSILFSVTDLECVRSDRVLFSGLSFDLKPGEVLRIAGQNGSGKTSLLRILCGLSQPESGSVKWNGRDIHELDDEYLSQVSYVGHQNGIKKLLTPIENLQLTGQLFKNSNGCSPGQALSEFGLAGSENIQAGKLSTGQQRRVALARLLISKTSLWILDEPFTSIDDVGRQYLVSVLQAHVENQGILILVSHDSITLEFELIKYLYL